MEEIGRGASTLLLRCILGLALYTFAPLIRMVYMWASRHPGHFTALAVALAMALLALHSVPRDGIVILLELSPPLLHGHTIFPELDNLTQYYSIASAAPHALLLPGSHIAESASDKIEVSIVLPAFPPPMVPSVATRLRKKRKKATAPAAPVATSNTASTATPLLSTAPTTKKGKTTCKKKAAKPVNIFRTANVGKDNQQCKSFHCGNRPWAEVGCWQHHYHQ
jgi:hypothetical protein